jgi:membrane protease YdiL (CAAX protease family)
MEASLTKPPPERPEMPEGAERPPVWPAWFAWVGFVVAILGVVTLIGTVAAIVGADEESPGFVVIATLAQGAVFVGTAVWFASRVAKPKAWHFGLRTAPFWPAVGWAALGVFSFFLVSAIYAGLVQPDTEQDVVESLGGDEGTFGLVVAGLMVIAVAPVVEEIFFRGFFYRALRSRFPIVLAALMDGLLFGVIHFNFEGADGLLILPPLALLGFIFCLVYERTGSLYPVIGMHAFNNSLAYAVQADDGWQVSVVVGPLVLAACALVPRLLPPGPRRVQHASNYAG